MMLLLLACAHRGDIAAPCPGKDLATEARDRGVATASAGPMSVPFTIRARTASNVVNAQGALIVSPPAAFRIEISGPIGPPQVVVASNGEGLSAYVAPRKLFVVEPALDVALGLLTGGALGGEGVVSILMGVVPILSSGTAEMVGIDTLGWHTPAGASAAFGLDCSGALHSVSARDAHGSLVMDAQMAPGRDYPEALTARVPPLSMDIDITFGRWRSATPAPAHFELAPPPGFTVVPLASLVGSGAPPPGPPQTPAVLAPTP